MTRKISFNDINSFLSFVISYCIHFVHLKSFLLIMNTHFVMITSNSSNYSKYYHTDFISTHSINIIIKIQINLQNYKIHQIL